MESYRDPSLSPDERARDLLARMTLEEKIAQTDMCRGVEFATQVHPAHFCAVAEDSDFDWDTLRRSLGARGIGFVHDVYSVPRVLNRLQRFFVEETRLGIPCIFTGEALHGVSWPGATVFPMPVSLGAAFDPALTERVGHAIAAETRALGMAEILAPNLDVARDPRWGRVEETFGEDTYLSARMAQAIITGEQGSDLAAPDAVAAEPKHYCVHGTPENGLNCGPARVGEREVETEFLPVFEAAFRAGARNAMASYNCIDGEAVAASAHYLRRVLKERFGLRGYVRADFGAVERLKSIHRVAEDDADAIRQAVMAGLDVQGFDFPRSVWEGEYRRLIESGRVPLAVLDEAVLRILRLKLELGLFERPYTDEARYAEVVRCEAHRALALEAARKSMVLLQNRGALLPLKPRRKLAVIGPSARRQRIGSYSSVPYGYAVPSVAEALRRRLPPQIELVCEDGCAVSERDIPPLPAAAFPDGVRLAFYADADFAKPPVGSDRAAQLSFNWILAKPHRELPFRGYGVRMACEVRLLDDWFAGADAFDGAWAFPTDDRVALRVDGATVLEGEDALLKAPFRFEKGRAYRVEVDYVCAKNGNRFALCVETHGEDGLDKAVACCRGADAAVLVLGDDTVTSGEGMDRNELKLYGRQRELTQRVAALGVPVVLVLEVGKPVDLSEESALADAILLPWFGGELGAEAIAEALLGELNPGGRLPLSFPRGVGSLPCYYARLPGASARYLEGEPSALYPFGHGLSYTRFAYRDLAIERGPGRYDATVTITVENAGDRAGDEVAQLYLRDDVSSVVTPAKRLRGFARVSLAPGEAKRVAFPLDFDSFKLYNLQREWVVEPGAFTVMVGASSEDIRLTARIQIE